MCQSWLVFELFMSCISLALLSICALVISWCTFSHPPLCILGLWSIYVSSLLGALLSQPHWHQWKIIQMRSFTPLLIKREKNNSWAIILQTWCVYHEYVHVYIVTSGPDHLQEICRWYSFHLETVFEQFNGVQQSACRSHLRYPWPEVDVIHF